MVMYASAGDMTTIDDDHYLTTADAKAEYGEKGHVSADLHSPDMTITVAENADDVDLAGIYINFANDYIRIQYREDRTRTLRIYIPEEYISPRTANELEAENDNVVADFRPIHGNTMMEMRVRVTRPTDAVFKLPKDAGIVFSYVDDYQDRLNESTGWDLPSPFGDREPWQYIARSEINDEDLFAVEKPPDGELMVQYDAWPDDDTEMWLPIQECPEREANVCYLETDDQYMHIVSTDNATAVRYKYEIDRVERLREAFRDMRLAVDRFLDWTETLV